MTEKPRIERFEQLVAWQKARALAGHVYAATNGFPGDDRSFADQLRRSAVSVAANIAEGFERGGMREFRQFLAIAKGSCAELRTHIYIAGDIGRLNVETANRLLSEATEVGRIIAGLRRSIAPQSLPEFRRRPAAR